MSLFTLDSQHQEQLLRLHDIDVDTAGEFCKVALQLFRSGPQPRMIEKASRKLDWSPEKLQSTLETIMELLKEAVKAEVLGKFNFGSSRLIAWLIEMCCWIILIDWLINRLIDWLIVWGFDWLIDWLIDWLFDMLKMLYFFGIRSSSFFSVGSAWRSAHFIDFDGPEGGIRQFARLGFWGIEKWNPFAAERRHVWHCPTEDIWLAFWSGGSLYFSRNASPFFYESVSVFCNVDLVILLERPIDLFQRFTHCFIGRLIDWLVDCSFDWLIDCSFERLIDWLINGAEFFNFWIASHSLICNFTFFCLNLDCVKNTSQRNQAPLPFTLRSGAAEDPNSPHPTNGHSDLTARYGGTGAGPSRHQVGACQKNDASCQIKFFVFKKENIFSTSLQKV